MKFFRDSCGLVRKKIRLKAKRLAEKFFRQASFENRDDTAELLSRIKVLHSKGRIDEVKKLMSEYPLSLSSCAGYWFIRGELSMHEGSFEESLGFFERCVGIKNHHREGKLGISKCLILLGKLQEAELLLLVYQKEHPHYYSFFERHAQIAVKQKHWEDALTRWARASEFFPKLIKPRLESAMVLEQVEGIGAALLWLEEVASQFPDRFEGYELRVLLMRKGKDWNGLLGLSQEIIGKWPLIPLGYLSASLSLRQSNRFREAQSLADQLIQRLPTRIEGFMESFQIYSFLEDWQGAERVALEVVKLKPKGQKGLWSLSTVSLRCADQDTSIKWAVKTIEASPKFILAYKRIIQIHLEKGDIDRASEHLDRLENQIGEEHPESRLLRVELQTEAGDSVGALQSLDLCRYLPDLSPEMSKKMANFHEIHGDLVEERSIYEKIIEDFPDHVGAHKKLILLDATHMKIEVMIARVDRLISKYPLLEGFYSIKFDLLKKEGFYTELDDLLVLMATKFPDSIELEFRKIESLASRFRFPEALVISEALRGRFPLKIRVNLVYVRILFKSGEPVNARNCLLELADEKRYHLSSAFFTLAVALFQREDTKFIREFTGKVAESTQSVFYHMRVLESRSEYAATLKLVRKRYFASRTPGPVKLNLYFHMVRLTNLLRLIEEGEGDVISQNPVEAFQQSSIKLGLAIEYAGLQWREIARFLERKVKNIARITHGVDRAYLDTYISPSDTLNVAKSIFTAIKTATPFSMIRLSDGEGHFLRYDSDQQIFHASDQLSIQRWWWPRPKLQWPEDPTLKNFERAAKNADILGIPCFHRTFGSLINEGKKSNFNSLYHRGLRSVPNNVADWVKDGSIPRETIITSCFVHHHLSDWGLYDYLFKDIESCSVISCHPTCPSVLKDRFGLEVRDLHLIPAESANIHQIGDYIGESHYPERFESLCQEIKVAYPGEVYLMAAGFVGKIYCDIIKEQGGIALDVGSMFDFWMSINTRTECATQDRADRVAIWQKYLESNGPELLQ